MAGKSVAKDPKVAKALDAFAKEVSSHLRTVSTGARMKSSELAARKLAKTAKTMKDAMEDVEAED